MSAAGSCTDPYVHFPLELSAIARAILRMNPRALLRVGSTNVVRSTDVPGFLAHHVATATYLRYNEAGEPIPHESVFTAVHEECLVSA